MAGFNPGLSVQQRGDDLNVSGERDAVLTQWGRAGSGFYPPGTPPGTIERVTDTRVPTTTYLLHCETEKN